MMFLTGSSGFFSKRRSRLVTMPTSLLPSSTTGTPEMLCERVMCMTSPIEVCGSTVIGSRITPASNFLTSRTSAAWRSTVMFLWMMPMPPDCAIVIARRASVTVSMAEDISGMLRRIARVRRVEVSTSRGSTEEWAGTR